MFLQNNYPLQASKHYEQVYVYSTSSSSNGRQWESLKACYVYTVRPVQTVLVCSVPGRPWPFPGPSLSNKKYQEIARPLVR